MRRALAGAAAAAAILTIGLTVLAQSALQHGVQDPSWAPSGRQLAISFFDRIWISGADGRGGKPLRTQSSAVERDPAWSIDGRSIAFAADEGGGFDLFVASADGKNVRRLTETNADERWPSWTPDGRIVFSRRAGAFDPWQIHVISATGGEATPLFPDAASDSEREPRVSPDGRRVAYISDRDSTDGDVDLWVADLPGAGGSRRTQRSRLTRVRGTEGNPAWAPDGTRVVFYAQREGAGSVWVTSADASQGSGRGGGPAVRPVEQPVLISRRGGAPAA